MAADTARHLATPLRLALDIARLAGVYPVPRSGSTFDASEIFTQVVYARDSRSTADVLRCTTLTIRGSPRTSGAGR